MCILIWLFLLFLNNSMPLKISSSNWSIALFCFINSEFQNISYGYAFTGGMKWFSFMKWVFLSTSLRKKIIGISFLLSGGTFIVANNWCSLSSVVCSGTIRVLYRVNELFLNIIYTLIFLALLIKYLHIWSNHRKHLSLFYYFYYFYITAFRM